MKISEDYLGHVVHRVTFNGNEIILIEKHGEHYVSLKPFVKALGLSWSPQYRLISKMPNVGQALFTMINDSDGNCSHAVALPWQFVHCWLFKIQTSRLSEKTRQNLMFYQKYFFRTMSSYLYPSSNVLETATVALNALEEEKKARQAAETMLAETRQTLLETSKALAETKCKSNNGVERNIRNKNI